MAINIYSYLKDRCAMVLLYECDGHRCAPQAECILPNILERITLMSSI